MIFISGCRLFLCLPPALQGAHHVDSRFTNRGMFGSMHISSPGFSLPASCPCRVSLRTRDLLFRDIIFVYLWQSGKLNYASFQKKLYFALNLLKFPISSKIFRQYSCTSMYICWCKHIIKTCLQNFPDLDHLLQEYLFKFVFFFACVQNHKILLSKCLQYIHFLSCTYSVMYRYRHEKNCNVVL